MRGETSLSSIKIAVVHDWLVTYAGSERVLEQILTLFPNADLFVIVDFLPDAYRHVIGNRSPRTSFIQKLPFARTRYRNYLPLMPCAIEQFDLSSYDLVISSSHAVAKGVRTGKDQLHICYCHTPMRYAWDLREQYLREVGLDRGIKGIFVRAVLDHIRRWDERTADRVDHFVANSKYIAERIRRAYHRDAAVIYPPVDIEGFSLSRCREDFYLAASRMVPYKRMDVIVEAFRSLPDRKLIVIGDGPDLGKLRSLAGDNVVLLGFQQSEVLRDYLQRARAFIFAAEEDFGIMPVEAQACGTPVIAFGRGGATETVVPLNDTGSQRTEQQDPTGLFFFEQAPSSLVDAILKFEKAAGMFDAAAVRANAEHFSRQRFRSEFREFVLARIKERARH